MQLRWREVVYSFHVMKNSMHRGICRLVSRKARIHVDSVKRSSVCYLNRWRFKVEFVSAYFFWILHYFWCSGYSDPTVLIEVLGNVWLLMLRGCIEDVLIQYENWWNVVCSGSEGWSLQYESRIFQPVEAGVEIRGSKLPSRRGW